MELKGVHNSFKCNRAKKLENAAVQAKKLGTGASSHIPCEPNKRGRKGSAPYLQHARVNPSCNPMARSLGELQLVHSAAGKKQAESSRQHIKVLYGTRTVFCCWLCRAFYSCACVLQKNRTHACILAAAVAFGARRPRGMFWGAWFALLHEALVSSNLSQSAAGKKAGRIITLTHQGLVWNTHRFLLLSLPRFLFLRLRPAREQNTCMHPRSCRRFWRTTAARHVFGPPGLPYCTKPW